MILIKNAIILPLDENTFIEKGDIIIKDSKIQYVGRSIEWREEFEETIDASDCIVMPGFVNSHTHLAMTLMRGIWDDIPLDLWLNNYIFPVEKMLTEEDVYFGSLLAIIESIRTGTTTITDFYYYPEVVVKAIRESGMRANISFAFSSRRGFNKIILKKAESFVKKFDNMENGRILASLAIHSPYTSTPALYAQSARIANKLNVIVQTHLHETLKEVEDYKGKYGKSPIEKLDEEGFFEARVTAAHCVWLTDAEIEILKEHHTGVVLNPKSNLKLGSGIPDVAKLLKSGLNLSIGTDGASSNNNLSVLEDMRLAMLIAKGKTRDPSSIDAFTAMRLATVNGALNLGFKDVGLLKEGYKADMVIIDTKKVNLVSVENPYSQIAYSMYPEDIDTVIIDGRIIMRDGKILTIDEDFVKSRFIESYKRLLKI